MSQKEWIEKMQKLRNGADLSRDEDLSIAVMNLISLEEHFFFTAIKTSNKRYYELLLNARNMRKELLGKLVKNPQGEEWCISKHLLAASMRLFEVGTKELSSKKEKEAQKYFTHAFDLYSLFFAINLKMIGTEELGNGIAKEERRRMSRFSEMIKKIVDCCREW